VVAAEPWPMKRKASAAEAIAADQMQKDAQQWMQSGAQAFLMRAGIAEGQIVLDFGCNRGNYALPAARAVGQTGRIYALDRNAEALKELAAAAQKEGLENVQCLHLTDDRRGIPLPAGSVDVVLLYDVLHRGYLPEPEQREFVLRNIHRVLKASGLLSLYPTHLKKYGMTFEEIVTEVEDVGFRLEAESRRRLVHDGNLTRGRVFTFTKNGQ